MKTLREQWNTGDKTLKQAASELGVHWRTVYRWTLMGTISFIQYRTNGLIFIPEAEIKRLKKERAPPLVGFCSFEALKKTHR